jgi:hypothetical protein
MLTFSRPEHGPSFPEQVRIGIIGAGRIAGVMSAAYRFPSIGGKSGAAATLTMVPMIVLGFFIQKYIAKGTTGGANK